MTDTVKSQDQLNDPSATPRQKAAPWLYVGGALLCAVLICLQYLAFREYAQREFTWSYPDNFDQIKYLNHSDETYRRIQEDGLYEGIMSGLRIPIANGMMLHVQASVLYIFLGPSRLSALTLNFIYLAIFEVVLAWTALWYTRRWSLALVAIGLSLAMTFNPSFTMPGGMMDFRIDFIARCLYGIFLCLVLRSGIFASRSWSLAVGAIASLLVLFRFLAALYITGVFGLTFIALCFAWWYRRGDDGASSSSTQRLRNLILAGLVFTVLTSAAIWTHWEYIKHYYVDHVSSTENLVRGKEYGAESAAARLLFYVNSLARSHAGRYFFGMVAALGVAGLVLRLFTRRVSITSSQVPLGQNKWAELMFILASLAIPIIVLTSYPSPSPVVVSIAGGALLWLVLWTFFAVSGSYSSRGLFHTSCLAVLGTVGLGAGVYCQNLTLSQASYMSANRGEVEKVLAMCDDIGEICQKNDWLSPRISVNYFVGHFHRRLIKPVVYERSGLRIDPQNRLGNDFTVSEVLKESEALALLDDSDIAVMNVTKNTSEASRRYQTEVYPSLKCLFDMRASLVGYCEKNMVPVKEYHFFGEDFVLFVRRLPSSNNPSPPVVLTGRVIQGDAPQATLDK